MPKSARSNGSSSRTGRPSKQSACAKYDAHHNVLDKAYGAFADLRRQLADSKTAVAERTDLLNIFANCGDSQRAFLLLEDYFEKLALARKDFPGTTWWPRMLAVTGKARLEETALLFLKNSRPLPTELMPHANLARFAEIEAAEQEQKFIQQLEEWLLPPQILHLDAPRASLRVLCTPEGVSENSSLHHLKMEFSVFRPRAGEKKRSIPELLDLRTRAAHEQELFPTSDWECLQWITDLYGKSQEAGDHITASGTTLLEWLSRWGDSGRLELSSPPGALVFRGQISEFVPDLANHDRDLSFTHKIKLADGSHMAMSEVKFFAGTPRIALIGNTAYLFRNGPSDELLESWLPKPFLPVARLSHRLLTYLRRSHSKNGADWEQLCIAHTAIPQFLFELSEESVRLRLMAASDRDQSTWQWNGHDWQRTGPPATNGNGHGKPEILDDARLEAATDWLRQLDWFTPEPGVWVGDANDAFLDSLAHAWPDRPREAEYLGNQAFQRLFLSPRKLKPKLMVQGSGIDWFSVCAAWEAEGMKLSPADLERLQNATGRFVKLPDGGWIELDVEAVQSAHETFAELGLDGLAPSAQRVDLLHATHLDETALAKFGDQPFAKALRDRVAEFKGVAHTDLPANLNAELRPYQKDGFDFLCHLSQMSLGGVLADDMGLGKTLQTLAWLSWMRQQRGAKSKPALVICPASVLHNWWREANKFTPDMKVLVLESGAARHNLRKQIPEHDVIVTNYSLLRRDLAALQKFDFQAIILDEAQYIKNPTAQVTQSVKQLKTAQRLALTGTPLENRLLDLWSITDFVQPGYLGSQSDFSETYEPKGENPELGQKVARKRLSAKLRPLLLRRLKKQVAQDLPDRIEERRDCPLGEEQRKLYLAELRRSREQIMQTVNQHGLAKSKMHVLAALTRLRQICCHPTLVGNDTASGKTDTLFELLEPLLAEGQKVLVFSQFVQMLRLLEAECKQREMPTYILTGETKQRQEVVNAFQNDPNPSVFLLSLRAAGTGLNLTTASYVVLYDPWWNPAVEAQAIDRSHRIGQTRTVNAYKLITPGTV
ncbi:MAG TPA: DEAD/DEAH box helicase, partial [Verrucomicrobiae bacterium]|nr:DEAD/DEAH box helicase [Verrucomicrobiae bacterium]